VVCLSAATTRTQFFIRPFTRPFTFTEKKM
jgi:hypothetical protein